MPHFQRWHTWFIEQQRWFLRSIQRKGLKFQPRQVTKKFVSKTTILLFPGLTGESRKTLDARLRTSGMTNKDVVCVLTNDRISNSEQKSKKKLMKEGKKWDKMYT